MIKMVVFDMAGTTVNEDNIVYKTLHKAINDAGFPVSLEQVLATGAGKEKLTAIIDTLKTTGRLYHEAQVNKIYNSFLQELAAAYTHAVLQPQPGAEQVFKTLKEKGIYVVLNTGYNQSTAISIMEKLQWKAGVQFDALITAGDVSRNRPHPDMIWLAMEKLGIADAAQVVKVGDSTIDIEEGKNAGCALSIGITTGAHTQQQLEAAAPDYIIHHLSELLPLLN